MDDSLVQSLKEAYRLGHSWLIVLDGPEHFTKRVGPFKLRSDAADYASERWGGEVDYEIVGMLNVVPFEERMEQELVAHCERLTYEHAMKEVPHADA